jgi:alanyl-tRNA synthetase
MHFFGDKYGDTVRVVQIGGEPKQLDGFSMELCGGTHVRATGEIGLFRIVSEAAIAAGVRRIEAVAGLHAYDIAQAESERLRQLATKLGSPLPELEKKLEAMLTQHKEMEKQLEFFQRKQASHLAGTLLEKIKKLNSAPAIIEPIPGANADELEAIADALKGQFKGVVVLAGATPGHVALLVTVSPEFIATFNAGKIIQTIAPIVGGKGGGRPDAARGAGKEPAKVPEALACAKEILR